MRVHCTELSCFGKILRKHVEEILTKAFQLPLTGARCWVASRSKLFLGCCSSSVLGSRVYALQRGEAWHTVGQQGDASPVDCAYFAFLSSIWLSLMRVLSKGEEFVDRSREIRDLWTENSLISHADFYSVYPGFFCHVPTPCTILDFRAQLTKKYSSIWIDLSQLWLICH